MKVYTAMGWEEGEQPNKYTNIEFLNVSFATITVKINKLKTGID